MRAAHGALALVTSPFSPRVDGEDIRYPIPMRALHALNVLAFFVAASCASFTADVSSADGGAADGGPVDGGAPDDGSEAADGKAGDPDAAPMRCGWPEFVDGFERIDLQGPWSENGTDGTGITLAPSSIQKEAGDKSLSVQIETGTGAERARFLGHDLSIPSGAAWGTSVVCLAVGAHLWVEAVTDATRPFEIGFGTKRLYTKLDVATAGSAQLVLREQDALPDGGAPTTNLATTTIPLKTWVEVDILYALSPSPTASLVVDGKPIATQNVPAILEATDVPQKLRIGAVYTTTAVAEYFIDEVSVR